MEIEIKAFGDKVTALYAYADDGCVKPDQALKDCKGQKTDDYFRLVIKQTIPLKGDGTPDLDGTSSQRSPVNQCGVRYVSTLRLQLYYPLVD